MDRTWCKSARKTHKWRSGGKTYRFTTEQDVKKNVEIWLLMTFIVIYFVPAVLCIVHNFVLF